MVPSVAVPSDVHSVLSGLDAVLAERGAADAGLVVVTGEHAAGPQPVQVLDRLREDQVQAPGVFTRRPAARRRARSGCSRVLGAEEFTGRAEPGSPR
jgi:hypothetical protein